RWPRDWSSDVCSSDLLGADEATLHVRVDDPGRLRGAGPTPDFPRSALVLTGGEKRDQVEGLIRGGHHTVETRLLHSEFGQQLLEIGRAPCRERVEIAV